MLNWLERALREDNPAARGQRSDYDLNRGEKLEAFQGKQLRAAAVLVPIVDHSEGPTVLLTKRTDHLSKHPGQISFPGGTVDPEDEDAVAAALRETHEEIGIETSHIHVAGFLDEYITGTGFEIKPVVALVEPGFSLVLQEEEVAEAFEVPLSFLLDRENHRRETAMWQGVERHYYAMPYEGYRIWGATAAMLVNLCDVMEVGKER